MLEHKGTPQLKDAKQTLLPFEPSAKRRKLALSRPKISNEAKKVEIGTRNDDEKESQDEDLIPVSGRLVPDSDANEDDGEIGESQAETYQTDLERTLPPIKTDKEAIAEYETMRALDDEQRDKRLDNGEWVKGNSSIYVDAFTLALDTVLEEESHLFNTAERQIFENWKCLKYEVQYLYAVAIPLLQTLIVR